MELHAPTHRLLEKDSVLVERSREPRVGDVQSQVPGVVLERDK